MTNKITSPNLYAKIRDGYLVPEEFTIGDLDIAFEHLTVGYEKMPSVKTFLDWCRRNGHIARNDDGGYYWTEPGPYDEEEIEEMQTEEVVDKPSDYAPADLAHIHVYYASGKRLSRKKKKAIKKSFLTNPFIKRVTCHSGPVPYETITF